MCQACMFVFLLHSSVDSLNSTLPDFNATHVQQGTFEREIEVKSGSVFTVHYGV